MNLVRWDPIRELDQFFARPLGNVIGRWSRLAANPENEESVWTPTRE